MMREILFRGKRLDNGEWVYGFYCHVPRGRLDRDEHMIQTVKKSGKMGMLHCVDPSTIGQYTGLLDKNGERIFEGDVVSTDVERPYLIVEFRDGCFMFNCNDGGEDYYDIMLPILKDPQTVYKYGEVIGNIHDNPEFCNGGEEE